MNKQRMMEIIMIGMSFVNYQWLGDYALHIYCVLLVVLLFTTIFGTPIRNSRAWLNLGFFSVQPSEFMKLGVVILLGKYLEFRERDIKNFRELLIPSLVTLIPVIIILKQPDFGTAIIFIPVLFTMLFVGGADVSHLLSIIIIVGPWLQYGQQLLRKASALFRYLQNQNPQACCQRQGHPDGLSSSLLGTCSLFCLQLPRTRLE